MAVRRVDPLVDGRDPADPLQFAGGKVTPSLESVYPAGSEIPIYVVVYPAQGGGPPRFSSRYFRTASASQSATPELPPADASGAIPFMSGIQPPPGQYEVKVTVRQGESAASRMIALRVQ